MKLLRILLICFIANITLNNHAQNRALYVDNFANILGTYRLEKELFEFAKKHEIKELILYDLHKINKSFPLGDRSQNQILADFILKAKKEYGVKRISASGESGNFFIEAIHPYNVSRKNKLERFDVYNLEYEYWNEHESLDGGYYCRNYLVNSQMKCNRENSFKYFIGSLETMRFLADEIDHDIEVEAYIGKYNHDEVKQISKHIDRILIHDYVRRAVKMFPYVKKRLELLDEINSNIKLSILYSAEMNFLGDYFKKHELHEAEKMFFDSLRKEEKHLDDHINWNGFSYYNYDYLKYTTGLKHKQN